MTDMTAARIHPSVKRSRGPEDREARIRRFTVPDLPVKAASLFRMSARFERTP
jgi:hypothetical protein